MLCHRMIERGRLSREGCINRLDSLDLRMLFCGFPAQSYLRG
jgi:hypothetical protein